MMGPADEPQLAVASDGSLAALHDAGRIVLLELPAGAAFAEIAVDPDAAASEIAWVGAPPRLLVLSRYAAHSTVHMLDPVGPRSIAEIRLELPMRLAATVGSAALVTGPLGAAVLATTDSHVLVYPFATRSVPVAAGAAATQFVVALAGSIEEWDPQSRMPKRRLRLPRAAAITAVGGSERVVWMTTQQEPARIDVIPLVNRGQPRAHELPEPIARIVSHPRSDTVACLGAQTGRLYIVDLDGRHKPRTIGPEDIATEDGELGVIADGAGFDALAMVAGRAPGVLVMQGGRALAIVPLAAARDEAAIPAVAAAIAPRSDPAARVPRSDPALHVPPSVSAPEPDSALGDLDRAPPSSSLGSRDRAPSSNSLGGLDRAPASSSSLGDRDRAPPGSSLADRDRAPPGSDLDRAPLVSSLGDGDRASGSSLGGRDRAALGNSLGDPDRAAPGSSLGDGDRAPAPSSSLADPDSAPAPSSVAARFRTPPAGVPVATPASATTSSSASGSRPAIVVPPAARAASERFSAWRDQVRHNQRPAPLEASAPPGQAGLPPVRGDARLTWRDEIVAWTRAVIAGAIEHNPPAAPAIDGVIARFALARQLQPVLVLLYGAHLCGERGVAPIDVARVLDRQWDEALGRGELAQRGVAAYLGSRVLLSPIVLRALDELPPTLGELVGEPGAPLAGPCVVVASAAEPLAEVAERCRARLPAAILVAHGEPDVADLAFEARAYGAIALVRFPDAPGAPPAEPIILVLDDAEAADQLALPRLA